MYMYYNLIFIVLSRRVLCPFNKFLFLKFGVNEVHPIIHV